MKFTLPELPYEIDSLAPNISAQTLHYHHEKHHAGYVRKLNTAIGDFGVTGASLDDIVTRADDPNLYNNAAQCWNHTFYWNSMSPAGGLPGTELAAAIERDFGSTDALRKAFLSAAGSHFASGWAWLVLRPDDRLDVLTTHDAGNPLRSAAVPLLTCDVWEHAYYLDHQNARGEYLEKFWELVNWEFVTKNIAEALEERLEPADA